MSKLMEQSSIISVKLLFTTHNICMGSETTFFVFPTAKVDLKLL